MLFSQPSAQQRRFRELVRDYGCVICHRPAEIHHVAGRKASHHKIKIGHEFILPLCSYHHSLIDQGHSGLRLLKLAMVDRLTEYQPEAVMLWTLYEFQKTLFSRLLNQMDWELDPDIEEAIQGWHR